MERDGLVSIAGDRHLEFTDLGRQRATRVMRKHRLAERLLVDVIGLEWEYVHDEACRWEHVISERVERRIIALLGDDLLSPYGNPIPGLAGLGEAASVEDFRAGLGRCRPSPTATRPMSPSAGSASRSRSTTRLKLLTEAGVRRRERFASAARTAECSRWWRHPRLHRGRFVARGHRRPRLRADQRTPQRRCRGERQEPPLTGVAPAYSMVWYSSPIRHRPCDRNVTYGGECVPFRLAAPQSRPNAWIAESYHRCARTEDSAR